VGTRKQHVNEWGRGNALGLIGSRSIHTIDMSKSHARLRFYFCVSGGQLCWFSQVIDHPTYHIQSDLLGYQSLYQHAFLRL